MFVSALSAGRSVRHEFRDGTGGYLYVISGAISLGGERLAAGDAARISDEPSIEIGAEEASELILVETRLDGPGWTL